MSQDTGHTPVRVSLREARDSIVRLRAALEHLDIPHAQIRDIIPASDLSGSHYVRMGTWNPDSVHALADALEGLTPTPPPLRRPGRPPLPPLAP